MAPTQGNVTSHKPDHDWLQKFKEILLLNGITAPVSDVIIQDAGLKGENLTSNGHYVTIKFEGRRWRKPLNLFMKATTPTSVHNEMVEDMKLFEKERVFFMKYIPAITEFCKKLGKEELLDIYPKCYFADESITVFENLISEGYELLDKEELQDFDAAKLAFSTLAKHHAIAYVFMKEVGGPDPFFKMFPNLDLETYEQRTAKTLLEPWINDGIWTNIAILEKCDDSVEGKKETIEMFQGYAKQVFDIFWGNLKTTPEEEKLLVLNHGDFWNNNMMFLRDKETGKFIANKALDFQITRYATPGTDFGYYMFTSLKPDMRRERLKELFTGYLKVLKETSRDLGHEIDISYDELYADYRRKFKFGFWFGIFASNEAAYAVRKDWNLDEIPDMSQFSAYCKRLIQKWLEEHPERCNEIGKRIVQLIREYNELSMD